MNLFGSYSRNNKSENDSLEFKKSQTVRSKDILADLLFNKSNNNSFDYTKADNDRELNDKKADKFNENLTQKLKEKENRLLKSKKIKKTGDEDGEIIIDKAKSNNNTPAYLSSLRKTLLSSEKVDSWKSEQPVKNRLSKIDNAELNIRSNQKDEIKAHELDTKLKNGKDKESQRSKLLIEQVIETKNYENQIAMLEKQLNHERLKSQELEKTQLNLKYLNNNLIQENDNLKNDITDLSKNRNELQLENNSLKNSNHILRLDIDKLQKSENSQIINLKNKLSDKLNQLKSNKIEIIGLKNEIELMKSNQVDIYKLQKQLQSIQLEPQVKINNEGSLYKSKSLASENISQSIVADDEDTNYLLHIDTANIKLNDGPKPRRQVVLGKKEETTSSFGEISNNTSINKPAYNETLDLVQNRGSNVLSLDDNTELFLSL